MNILNRLSVAGKLAFAFACILVVMIGVGVFSIGQLQRVNEQSRLIAEVRLKAVHDALLMVEDTARYRTREYRFVTVPANERREAADRLVDAQENFHKHTKAYEALVSSDTERALFTKVTSLVNDYFAFSKTVQDLAVKEDLEGARDILTHEGSRRFDLVTASLHDLVKYNDEKAAADAAHATQLYTSGRNLLIGALLLAAVLAVVLGWVISKAITVPLRNAVDLAETVARGDLTREMTATGRDELAQLTRALGAMVVKLRELVGEVRSGVESVSSASAQIATGNQDLSSRTEQTASNLQETSASMEQITGTVTQSADTAREAHQIAASASDAAKRGGEVVHRVVDNMQEISASSKKIADIIGVIDGIAFQTNILALNAAVEAARAGEQGRGFAVVAGEVRNLAQRSAQAAKEIKQLIEASVERVDNGAKLVEGAGTSMDEIVRSVGRMTDLMGEISSAAQEQRQGIGQVNQAVNQLDEMTQQNAALVEESAAAANALSDQARRLSQIIGTFRLSDAAISSAPVAVAPTVVRTTTVAKPRSVARATKVATAAPRETAPREPEPTRELATAGEWEAF